MKTTTDNHIDKLLHEAMKQRAAKVPPLADNFAEKVMGSLTARPLQRERGLKFWPLAVAACVAGFVVIFLAPPRTTEEQSPLASEETTVNSQEAIAKGRESRAKSQEPRVESQELTASSQEPRVESQEAQGTTQPSPKGGDGGGLPKAKSQQPIAEPMLAEAEIESGATEEYHEAPMATDPFLAVAAQVPDIRSRGERLGREIAQLTDSQIKYQ